MTISRAAYPGAILEQVNRWIVRKVDAQYAHVNTWPERANEKCIPISLDYLVKCKVIDPPELKPTIALPPSGNTAVAYDVETGGFDARLDALVQISAVEFDVGSGETVAEFNTLVKPNDGLRIGLAQTQLHGHDRASLQNSPSEKEALRAFRAWALPRKDLVWWAHSNNTDFDYRFLTACAKRNLPISTAFEWEWAANRKLSIARLRECGRKARNGLGHLAEDLGIQRRESDKHDSLEDCRILAKVVAIASRTIAGFAVTRTLDDA